MSRIGEKYIIEIDREYKSGENTLREACIAIRKSNEEVKELIKRAMQS